MRFICKMIILYWGKKNKYMIQPWDGLNYPFFGAPSFTEIIDLRQQPRMYYSADPAHFQS